MKKSYPLFFSLIIGFLVSGTAFALPVNNPIPGGILVIDVAQTTEPKPKVKFGEKPVFVTSKDSQWFAVVGLPKNILPGKYMLSLKNSEGESRRRQFNVNPLPANLRQRTIDLPQSLESLNFYPLEILTLNRYYDSAAAAESSLSGHYQYQQIVKSGSYIPFGWLVSESHPEKLIDHPWITYITKPESTVVAPSIAVVEQIFLSQHSATTVVLDHYNGSKSIISNLQDVVVKLGDTIKAGSAIGTSLTVEYLDIGRVDWQIVMNEFAVDPMQFIIRR